MRERRVIVEMRRPSEHAGGVAALTIVIDSFVWPPLECVSRSQGWVVFQYLSVSTFVG